MKFALSLAFLAVASGLEVTLKTNVGDRHAFSIDDDDVSVWADYQSFVTKHGRHHDDVAEYLVRFGVFKQSLVRIRLFQAAEKGTARYGVTQFADLTKEEFEAQYTSAQWGEASAPTEQAEEMVGDAPDAWDWRQHNAVTEVKNQGQCGSCWAFSTTGNIEGQWAIKKGKLISLSEQELVDCDKVDQGCQGGLPSDAYKQVIKFGGLETEAEYPYVARGQSCQLKRQDNVVYINSSLALSQDEGQLKAWLAQNGPISIGINAAMMQYYMGGVAHPWSFLCNPKKLDHGVLIVGYGVDGKKPYWIIKNSWGPTWGEKGYYLIYRGEGVCGLNTMATSAVVH